MHALVPLDGLEHSVLLLFARRLVKMVEFVHSRPVPVTVLVLQDGMELIVIKLFATMLFVNMVVTALDQIFAIAKELDTVVSNVNLM